ncbi:hypothetical protein J1N35_014945 [Gossypium stocksii]|uniref:Uncharacterized protein n=1 Tax=Gossypium stocksii TaxID=47602 RepID=A0A9D3VY03_9ROSI|nr:hypothetical protein J1N35_014945 [Gossypium stocksii]
MLLSLYQTFSIKLAQSLPTDHFGSNPNTLFPCQSSKWVRCYSNVRYSSEHCKEFYSNEVFSNSIVSLYRDLGEVAIILLKCCSLFYLLRLNFVEIAHARDF